MDIHKPKPWHGFREFLKEYLIIVVGVLTALGAEQMAELVNHRREAEEARRSLNAELAYDLMSFDVNVRQIPCALHRLDELTVWHRALEGGAPIRLREPTGSPTYKAFRQNAWRVASTSGVALMTLQERLTYSDLYDEVTNNNAIREEVRHRWESLEQATAAKVLSREEIHRVGGDLMELRQAYRLFADNARGFRQEAARLGVKPLPASGLDAGMTAEQLCRPILPA